MSSVRQSLFIYFSATNVITLLEFGESLILARLLTPAEIGVYSVAAVVIGIAHVLRNFGTGAYIVQEKELTEARLRSAFGLTLLLSWGLGLALVLASGTIAEFYREPGVREVLLLLTVNLLLVPFGAVTMACLQRDMRFGALSLLDLAGVTTHIVVSIALALLGFGYMSLAWASLAGLVVTITGATYFRPKNVPRLPGFAEVRRVLGFGAFSTSAHVVGTVGMGTPEIILGRMLGMEAVGLFSRAHSVTRLFGRVMMRTVGAVALPYFSQQRREGADLKASFLKSATYMTGAAFPFFVVLAFLAFPVVRLLYGPQWDASIPAVRMLCIAGAIGAPFWLMGSIILAVGQPKYSLLIESTSLPVKVALVILATPWGIEAVAASFILTACYAVVVNFLVLRKLIGLTFRELIAALIRSAGAGLLAAVGPALIWWVVPVDSWRPWIVLAAGLPAGTAGWCLGLYVLRHPLWDEMTHAVDNLRQRMRG